MSKQPAPTASAIGPPPSALAVGEEEEIDCNRQLRNDECNHPVYAVERQCLEL